MRHKITVDATPQTRDTSVDITTKSRNLTANVTRQTANTGTTDYNELENRPQINGVLLTGDVGLDALGVPDSTSDLINDSGFITSADIPAIPTKTSDLQNDSGFITSADVPAAPVQSVNGQTGAVNLTNLVQDLGAIDGDAYDWDIGEYLNTLTETGSYTFLWDEFKYWVDIEALVVDGTTTVQQIYWGTEEGSGSIYYRNILIENGEITDVYVTSYMTSDVANNLFASKNHQHFRTDNKAVSVWDYCDGNQIRMQNGSPIFYTDTLNSRQYIIETWQSIRQPTYNYQKVTDLIDSNVFYQRSGLYQSGRTNWGNWYKFTGEIYTPGI